MALGAMLVLAGSLKGQAGGDAHARVGHHRNPAGFVAVGALPGDGAPSKNPQRLVERTEPRRSGRAVASQVDARACAPASNARLALIAGGDAPTVDYASIAGIADIARLPLASADAGQLRLHPGQAPPWP